jgi:hypothetical protein
MVTWLVAAAVVAKLAVLGLGLVVLYYTVNAARHTGDEGLWFLSAGISLVGVGFFFSGWLTPLVGVEQALAVTLTSIVSAAGLILIVYSMFTDTHVRAAP